MIDEQDVAAAAPPERRATPLSDLFATAVHRFGSAWADLVAATLLALAAGSLPVLVADRLGWRVAVTTAVAVTAYSIAYFLLLGHVVLRGLPTRPGGRRRASAAITALLAGALAAAVIILMGYLAVVPLPLLLLAVPAAAAGDAGPVAALPRGALLALRNYSRTWGVWLIMIVFSVPVWICFALLALPLLSGATQFFVTLGLAAPIVWPCSALLVRALYGDLTGRLVVAAQDRTG